MKKESSFLSQVPPLFSDLQKILEGEIDCSHTTRTQFSTDGSPYTVLPQAIIYPKNSTDIKHILALSREYTIPITVRGKGVAKNGASLCEGIVLDLTRYFSHIRNINMMNNTITVDAGVTVHDLLLRLHSWHYDIPLLSMSDTDATIGAVVATKSISSSSFHHSSVREWIEGMTIVVDNGEEHHLSDGITPSGRLLGIYQEVFPLLSQEASVIRASKPKGRDDSTGYNIWSTSIGPRQLIDQLTGSEGTLAILTSITFRITPHKPHTLTTCIPVLDKKQIPVYSDIATHHQAESIFMYDEAFMQLSERYHPTLTPYFPNTPYALLVTHTAHDTDKLHSLVRSFRNALPVESFLLKTIDDKKILLRIMSSEFLFLLFSLYTQDTLTPITIGDGIITSPHNLPLLITELEDYLNSLGKLYTITGNVGSGHISVITLFDNRSPTYTEDTMNYGRRIFTIVKKYNGGMSASGGEGLSRTPFLPYFYSESTLTLFKRIKDIWDPLAILNTGKKINVSVNYLQQHTKKG